MESNREIPKAEGEIKLIRADIKTFFDLLRNKLKDVSLLKLRNLTRTHLIKHLNDIKKDVPPNSLALLGYLGSLKKFLKNDVYAAPLIDKLTLAIKSGLILEISESLLAKEIAKGEIHANLSQSSIFSCVPPEIRTGIKFTLSANNSQLSLESNLSFALDVIKQKVEFIRHENNLLNRKQVLFAVAQELQGIIEDLEGPTEVSSNISSKIVWLQQNLTTAFQDGLITYVQLVREQFLSNERDTFWNDETVSDYNATIEGLIYDLYQMFPRDYPKILQSSELLNLSFIYQLYNDLAFANTNNIFTSIHYLNESLDAASLLLRRAIEFKIDDANEHKIKTIDYIQNGAPALLTGTLKILENLQATNDLNKRDIAKIHTGMDQAVFCFNIKRTFNKLYDVRKILLPSAVNVPNSDSITENVISVFENVKSNLIDCVRHVPHKVNLVIIKKFFENIDAFTKDENITNLSREQLTILAFDLFFALQKNFSENIYIDNSIDTVDLFIIHFLSAAKDDQRTAMFTCFFDCYSSKIEMRLRDNDIKLAWDALQEFRRKLEILKVNKLCSPDAIKLFEERYYCCVNDIYEAKSSVDALVSSDESKNESGSGGEAQDQEEDNDEPDSELTTSKYLRP